MRVTSTLKPVELYVLIKFFIYSNAYSSYNSKITQKLKFPRLNLELVALIQYAFFKKTKNGIYYALKNKNSH